MMKLLKNLPDEIDYDQFKWLGKGDRLAIATEAGVSPSMVYHTLKKRSFNINVLTIAMEKVEQIKLKLLTVQRRVQELDRNMQKLNAA